MKMASLKLKIDRLMNRGGFKKSKKEKSKIKGLPTISSGFEFERIGEEVYLYWTWGNFIDRGKSNEEGNPKTEQLYEHLISLGMNEDVELFYYDFRNRMVIRLKAEE